MTSESGKSGSFKKLSRRSFIQSTAVVGSQALLLQPVRAAAGTSLEGYTNMPSVAVGGTIDFFLRDPQALGTGTTSYPITITRVGAPDVYMTSTNVSIGNQVVPADASTNGCRWARGYQLTVPNNWPSGLYYAYVGSGGNACTVPFVIRAVSQTPGVKLIVNVPMLTVHAYNAYGGKSIYDYNSTGGVRAPQVSLDRPFTEAFNSFFDVWSQYFVRWLAKNGIAADFCTDFDIETNPSLLAPYQLYAQAGHDEYWSTGRRDTMDAFVARGGNCAYLGGNTAWFQSRLQAGTGGANRTLVCYKDNAADPVTDPALKTNSTNLLVPKRPENTTTGLGFITGCAWASGVNPRPVTPSVVMRAEHWAFAGTPLAQGSSFGGTYVGYECDSAAFVLGADARPYPTGFDSAPSTLRILAQADGSNWDAYSLATYGSGESSGYAHIAVFSRGGGAGTVFNVGSTDWAYGLRPELDGSTPTPISRITLNVINRLVAPWSETADVRQFHKVVSGAAWNTYYTTGTNPPAGSDMALDGWAFRAFPLAVTGSVPVYRFASATAGSTGTRYRYSRSNAIDATWVLEATSFHAYAAPRSDAVAVYEHTAYSAAGERFFLYSTSATAPSGWNSGPLVFYTPSDSPVATPAPVPGFTLAAAPSSVTAVQGASANVALSITPVNGFSGTVSFATTGLPTGASATFTAVSGGNTLRLAAGATTPAGSYTITVTGTAAGTSGSSTTLTFVVTAAAVQSFTLAAGSTSLRLPFGGLFGDSIAVNVIGKNGFNSAVTFSVSGVPAGLVASFSPASSATGTRLSINKALFSLAAFGNYTVTVKGTSGAMSTTTTFTLVVSLF